MRAKQTTAVVLVLSLLSLWIIPSALVASTQWNGSVAPASLPSLMISYGSLLSSGDAATPEDIAKRINLSPILAKLNSELDHLGARIPECLLFSHESFVVQTAYTGQSYGLAQVADPPENLLFVSTPIEKLNGKVLVVLSCTGPRITKIFTLDSALHPELVYASDRAPSTRNGKFEAPLTNVYQIRVLTNSRFYLRECDSRPVGVTPKSRNFLVDTSDGKVVISFEADN